MKYTGDISIQDAQVLATYAALSNRVLEFGVGGSTQVIAQSLPYGGLFASVDTETDWIDITRQHLAELGIIRPVEFIHWSEWENSRTWDMVFVDGADALRREFATQIWPFLRIGGVLLWHDMRRQQDAEILFAWCAERHLEIDTITMNERASNIAVIRKKISEPYQNWNSQNET